MFFKKIAAGILAAAIAVTSFTGVSAAAQVNARAAERSEVRGIWLSIYDYSYSGIGLYTDSESTFRTNADKFIAKIREYNLNTIYMQVRANDDAAWKSSTFTAMEEISPSANSLAKKGKNTRSASKTLKFDPLKIMVEEAHKNDVDLIAWMNPYRRSSSYFLNPGATSSINRVNTAVNEVMKYDVDGVIFDDYFYPSGMPTTEAAEDYNDWKNSGTSLSFGDWRRENINAMVADVYNMIQELDPSIKFGISPAGAACSDPAVAKKHGVDPIPKGSDWQYNGIFSDPVAWLKAGTVDYISPQLYWKTDHRTNPFGPMTLWWSKIAKQFGRHHYASHSLTFLQSSNTLDDWKEVGNQLQYSRAYTKTAAPGAIYYSACDIDGKKVQGLGDWLKRNKYAHPALTPAISWKEHAEMGTVDSLVCDGKQLMWKAEERMRYTVYAIPAELTATDVEKSTTGGILADYLLGMTYTNSFEIPAEYAEGYQFAVCILDRYGNEFQPMYIDIANAIDVIGEDAVTIEFDGWQLTTTKPVERLQIFNAMGQMMQEATDTDAIDVSGMPTGIYIVKALTGRQTAVKKIYIR